jgi:SAM-dependent methyltransferase
MDARSPTPAPRKQSGAHVQEPRLYDALAPWWPLLSPPAEYEEAAMFYQRVLIAACDPPPRTLLELGSGGGNNASHLKARFEVTLVDQAPGMLAVSRALNPDCTHVEGDMRAVRLGRHFDSVLIQDAIGYMTTEHDLRQALETAFVHCRPGGVALFAPDYVRENFRPSTQHGGHDGEARSLRYLEWTWDPDPSDSTYTVDIACLLRDRSGSVVVEQDRHVLGLFAQDDWLRLLAEVGFQANAVPCRQSEPEPAGRTVFLAIKPVNGAAMAPANPQRSPL